MNSRNAVDPIEATRIARAMLAPVIRSATHNVNISVTVARPDCPT